jgi:dual-specificity kinase
LDADIACRYFKRYKLDFPSADTTRASRRFVKNMKRLSVSCQWLLTMRSPRKLTLYQDIIPASTPFLKLFLDLLEKIFIYDPSRRITARQALEHPWFRELAVPDDGTEAAKIRLERMRAESEYGGSTRLHPVHL